LIPRVTATEVAPVIISIRNLASIFQCFRASGVKDKDLPCKILPMQF
jgi:hypothetical protein